MNQLIQIYKKNIFLWYLVSFLFSIFLVFNIYQIFKIVNNYRNFVTLVESKREILLQIENLYQWMAKIKPETIEKPKTIPIEIALEVNSLPEILFNLSPLYSENKSLFKIKKFIITPCERESNETSNNTCSYVLKLSGEKIKYGF